MTELSNKERKISEETGLSRERIAHDLALVWTNHVLSGKIKPFTNDKHLVEEYLAAYSHALEKLP